MCFAAVLAAAGWLAWRYGAPFFAGQKAETPNTIAISPEEYQPLYTHLNEKRYEEARRAAEALLKKYPNDVNTLQVIGSSYLRQGRETNDAVLIEKAGETFDRVLALLPAHIGAISDLSTTKRLLGKYDEGIAILEAAGRDFPFAQSLETDLALMREEAQKSRAR